MNDYFDNFADDPFSGDVDVALQGTFLALNYDPTNERYVAVNFLRMSRQDVIEAEIARLQQELAELRQFGADDFEDSTILRISMQYPNSSTVYKYAAIKIVAMDAWFMTGTKAQQQRGSNMFSWAELCQWMRPHVVRVEVMHLGTVLFDRNAIEADSNA